MLSNTPSFLSLLLALHLLSGIPSLIAQLLSLATDGTVLFELGTDVAALLGGELAAN